MSRFGRSEVSFGRPGRLVVTCLVLAVPVTITLPVVSVAVGLHPFSFSTVMMALLFWAFAGVVWMVVPTAVRDIWTPDPRALRAAAQRRAAEQQLRDEVVRSQPTLHERTGPSRW